MPKLPRIIVPNTPHHVTQRGNRRQKTFFCDSDYSVYLTNLMDLTEQNGVTIEAYCLMPNHIHLILTPPSRDALIDTVAELHRRYTRYINLRNSWRGHLWQGRFFSVALSPEHYEVCVEYVEANAERAGLVGDRRLYKWQSHQTTLDGSMAVDFDLLREMTRTGRPRGPEGFLSLVERCTGYDPRPKKSGPKPKSS